MDYMVSQVLDLKELVSQAHRDLMDHLDSRFNQDLMVYLRDLMGHNTSKHQGSIFLLVFKAHDLTIILHKGLNQYLSIRLVHIMIHLAMLLMPHPKDYSSKDMNKYLIHLKDQILMDHMALETRISRIPLTELLDTILMRRIFRVLTGVAQPVAFGQGQQFLPVHPQNPGAFVQNPSGALPKAYPDNHLSQVDVNELFSKLLKTGILKLSQPDSATTRKYEYMETGVEKFMFLFSIEEVNEVAAQPPAEEEEDQNEDQDVPDLTNFTIEELKQRYDSVINRLYTGIQCYSCGMRFTTSQTDVYADHLDWHYRQNRTEKDVSRKVTHRRWYYSLTDWIEFEEIADLEERAKSQFFEKVHEEVVLKTQEAAKEKEFQSVPAGPAGAVESCEICQEQFEQYWDEEEEEWHLKNAIRVDGKIYHPSCYEDYQNTSSFDCTPSPSKTPVENPLNIMLNIVKNELQEPCESPKVKEERIDTPPACTEESIATPTEIKIENDTVESV
ncbi:Pre-mRNA cleavage complex 2 protein Pcf11 [Camelus dromedarius]|uniref:Pre-mRNA cleavage complex 2 protein Pcf11 n=1 Tax=Camelus dromedarius TaxID=9838 RepID=A0A5N4DL93_CAMDR|nr:Pre-mRNA cleavage complex 2 protein Pcf11 [Camelus dromedarius]